MRNNIKIYPVACGDFITLNFLGKDDTRHSIVIDAGFAFSYPRTLKPFANRLLDDQEKIDLFVITHTDADHIGGMNQFIKDFGDKDLVKEFWFNWSPYEIKLDDNSKKSYRQGIRLKDYLIKIGKIKIGAEISSENETTREKSIGNAVLKVLSPNNKSLINFKRDWDKYVDTKGREAGSSKKSAKINDYNLSFSTLLELSKNFEEDDAIPNGSSIAFLFELNNFKTLFLGDAHPSIIVEGLESLDYNEENKLKVDYVKLSHHGSRGNTSSKFLNIIDCENYIVSANGKAHNLPNKETLVKIIDHNRLNNKPTNFFFSCDTKQLRTIFSREEMSDENYTFKLNFPEKPLEPIVIPF